MVDADDEDYGELAGYYGSISLILSSTNVNPDELMTQVNGFAQYNMNKFSNEDQEKFINYRTLGKIYTSYITTEGVPEQAETVMTQALSDLEDYSGEDATSFNYYFNDSLSVIYEALAKASESDTYYTLTINACQEVVNQITAEVKIGADSDNENIQSYNKAYVNKMCKIAEIYGTTGDYDSAIATYEEAESVMGKDSSFSNKIYAEHLNYIYKYYEAEQSDPMLWSEAQATTILAVYYDSQDVKDISNNTTWVKRKSVMDKLAEKDYSMPVQEEDAETDDTTTEEMGE
jgi:serine/threonine-protein kinase